MLTHASCWPEVRRGAERYTHELAAALAAAGHRVRIVAGAPAAGRTAVLGVDVRRLRRPAWTPARWADLGPEVAFGAQVFPRLAASRTDVWHAMGTADAAAAALAGRLRPGLRTVVTDHGFPSASSRARRPDARLHRYVVSRIDAYVCVSQAAGDYLRRDFAREPDIVPPGVDTARFRPGPRREAHPVLAYSGSLTEPRKGIGLLLAAVALLAGDIPDLQVWLMGPGDPAGALAAAPPGARERVSLAGELPDAELAERYARAWVTVLPSVAESFGMALLESLSCGTPVVARVDGGGPGELVTGEVGRLADGNAPGLARACAAALELSRRSECARACRDRAAGYDWRQAIVPRMVAVYGG